MFPPLSSIRERRRKLGWTQKKLADMSGVSQSYIAKIERGNLMPTYEMAKRIFEALDRGEFEESSPMARDIMVRDIISVEERDRIGYASELMEKHGISQIPVFRGNDVVGLITESDVMRAYREHGHNASMAVVSDFMSDPPPLVPGDMSLNSLISILTQYQAILVHGKNGVEGIITRADIVSLASWGSNHPGKRTKYGARI